LNRRNFEGRLVVNMVGGIIRQDDLFPVRQKLNWESLYHLADYHKVASIIYLGILGAYEDIPDKWKDALFVRYQQSLHYIDACKKGENRVLNLFTVNQIPCIELSSPYLCELYPVAGSCGRPPIRLLIQDERDYNRAKGYLIDADFITTTSWPDFGERMEMENGIACEIFHTLPFESSLYEKELPKLIAGAYPDPDFPSVSQLSIEYNCVFSMARLCYHYAQGQLTIRELLDHFLYEKHCREEDIDLPLVESWYRRLGIESLALDLMHIAYMWFDSIQNLPEKRQVEDLAIYDEIEDSILEGRIPQEGAKQRQAVQLAQDIARADERARNRSRHRQSAEKVRSYFLHLIPGSTPRKDDGEKAQVAVHIGEVPIEMQGDTATAITPYYMLRIPPAWADHVKVMTERMNERYLGSSLPREKRNSDNYRTVISFISEEGDEIPVIYIDMYSDPKHAQAHLDRIDRSYPLGTLIHSVPGHRYTEYLIVYFPEPDYDGEDADLLDEFRWSLADIAQSLLPVKGAAQTNTWNPSDEELM
jgi:hypothetical protein